MDRYEILCGGRKYSLTDISKLPVVNPLPASDEVFSPPPWDMKDVKACKTFKELLDFMKKDGGPWMPADDPVWGWLGYARNAEEHNEGIMAAGIRFSDLKNSIHDGYEKFRIFLQSNASRQRLGEVLSRRQK